MKTHRTISVWALLTLAMFVPRAYAISPIEQRSYDSLTEWAANNCINYVGKTAKPAIETLKIAVVRVLLERRVLLCPDNTLASGQDVIWYGAQRAMVWNPSAKGTNEKVGSLLDAMTREDAFPGELRVWNAQGQELKDQTVPTFRVRCASGLWRDCASR